MEEQETTPLETEVPTETSVEPQAQSVGEQTGETEHHDNDVDTHRTNWNNGRRRIEQRQSMKARIKELESRLAQYEGKDDDYSKFQTEQLRDRLDDMHAMNADAEATDFAQRAEQWFGDSTQQFMNDTYRYANYVNKNEPDLLRYANREYGPILLHEWYKRMDNANLRNQWIGMTQYEKGSVLANLYSQIADAIQRASHAPAQKTNIPVPNGGRQSPGPANEDDFGAALGEAFNRHNHR